MLFFRFLGWLVFLASMFLPVVSDAQHKVHRQASVWPELQIDYVFKSTSYLYFRNHYRYNLNHDLNYLEDDGPLQYLERVQFRAGFEHSLSPKMSAGISQSYAIERTRKILFNEIFLRHLSKVGKYGLTKRVILEHLVRWPQEDIARVRFRADLDRDFKLKQKTIRSRLAYELFYNLDYSPDETQNLRWIDRTRLRFEILYPLNPYLSVGPYFTRQTDYTNINPSYNTAGKLVREGGKQNAVMPIFGLDVRYVFFKGGKPFPRNLPINRNN